MQLKMFCIYDSKAEAYMRPFCFNATGLALRAFADMAEDRGHEVGRHPEDYTLFEIGTFEDGDGRVTMYEAHRPLGTGIEYAAKADPRQQDLMERLDNG